jgi:hypothetical protein
MMVAHAVACEPVSVRKFPANREINREFRRISTLCEILEADTPVNSKTFRPIPYATEQGIISAEQGILIQKQGIFLVQDLVSLLQSRQLRAVPPPARFFQSRVFGVGRYLHGDGLQAAAGRDRRLAAAHFRRVSS